MLAAVEADPRFRDVAARAGQLIGDYLRLAPGELTLSSHVVDDLGADSLALIELGFQISETFGVPMLDTGGDKLVFRELVAYILENMPEA